MSTSKGTVFHRQHIFFFRIRVITLWLHLGHSSAPKTEVRRSSMSIIRNAIPASLRRPLENSRSAQGFMPKALKTNLIAGPEPTTISLVKSRFAPLPQEPEDARLTGATRSLNRRLLALNVPVSLRMSSHHLVPSAKIAEF